MVSILACLVVFVTTYALILPAITASNAIAINSYLDDFSIMTKPNNSDWVTLKDGDTIDLNDQVKVSFDYTIPANTLNDGVKSVTYQLPFAVVSAGNGNVTNRGGQIVGTYTIYTSGLITITFNDEYVTRNNDRIDDNGDQLGGESITGSFTFTGKIDSSSVTEGGSISVITETESPINLTITDRTAEEEHLRHDLEITKRYKIKDSAKGLVEYTIEVSSVRGTQAQVQLTDIMTDILLYSDITIKDENGNTIQTVSQSSISDLSNFALTLPKMDENSKYVITYTAKTENDLTESKTVKNKATVESKGNNNVDLKAKVSVDTTITPNYVTKFGWVDTTNNLANWTITVNADHNDIGNWTLSDTLNGKELTGIVQIKNENTEEVINTTLPYKFPAGTTDKFTVTYSTPYTPELGSSSMTNQADLTPPTDSGYTTGATTGTVDAWGGKNYPLAKKANSITPDLNSLTATIEWTMTIKPEYTTLTAQWTLFDKLWDSQWYTYDQMLTIYNALASSGYLDKLEVFEAIGDDGVNLNNPITFNPKSIDQNLTYRAFEAYFNKNLEVEDQISFTYTSTAPLGDGTQSKPFRNESKINNLDSTTPGITYTPTTLITKRTNNGSSLTYKEGGEKSNPEWLITVKVPEGYTGGDMILTETLPEGLTLNYLEILADGVFGVREITEAMTHSISENSITYEIKTEINNQIVKVTIPESLLTNSKLKEIRFVVRCTINDNAPYEVNESGNKVFTFNNEASVTSEDGKTSGSSSSEQTVTETKKESTPAVVKNCTTPSDNIMPFTVKINTDAEDLDPNAETLDLTDTLTIPGWIYTNGCDEPLLVSGSVKLYYMNADGSKGNEITSCTVQQSTDSYYENGNTYYQYILKVSNIPDETPVILEYSYKFSGPVGVSFSGTNKATVTGVSGTEYEGSSRINFNIQESTATANIDGITIYKVDEEDYYTRLRGASFKLEVWTVSTDSSGETEESWQDVTLSNPTTNSSGILTLSHLMTNTAYKLTETQPPSGYLLNKEPLYFYIEDTSNSELNLPTNINRTPCQVQKN